MKKGVLIIGTVWMAFILISCTGIQVTFDYMDLEANRNVKVTDGFVTEPGTPVIEGMVFLGWYNESTYDTRFDFEQEITESLTAYGKFVSEREYIDDVLPMTRASEDVYYEIFVRSFADSDNDGIGDLNGVRENLDYLDSLGITAIWLMPIHPSPSYHGYDVTDYYGIHEDYGTMADFEALVDEANDKGIDIIIDLVVNHTSDLHPWYVNAKSSTDSEYRDWYKFPEGSNEGYASFGGGMRDLNYDNPAVDQEMKNIMAFYIEKGVHGFRLDAVTKLFESDHVNPDIDGALLIRGWQQYIETLDPNAYIISEAWYADYYDYADFYIGSKSLFDFNLRDEIIDRVLGNSTYLFVNRIMTMYEMYETYRPDFMNGIIIGNHDLDRIASLGGFDGYHSLERLKLAASIQMTLPGNPFIYYGEEIAMKGYRDYTNDGFTKPGYDGTVYDEVRRTPFIWGSDDYQTSWYTDDQNNDTMDVETQMQDSASLWTHYQTMIALRRENPALMYGNDITPYVDNSSAIQGFVRHYHDGSYEQAILVIHNMYNIEQTVALSGNFEILYGSLTIPTYGTLIVEINPADMGDYM